MLAPSANLAAAGERVALSLAVPRRAALGHAALVLLLSTTVLERFGLNFGSYSLNAAFLGMYGFLATAAVMGVLMLSVARALLVGACFALALTSSMVNEERVSTTSLLLLGAMYLPYLFVLRPQEVLGESGAQMVRRFLDIALLCALAGIAQFYLQFIWQPDWLFDYTARVPTFLHGPANYNTVIPMGATMKSNGFFFREPSGFSFIMALALIAEGATTKRPRRLLCYGVALLLTYSGTGLLALFLGMSFPLGRKTITRWSILAIGGGLAIAVLGDTLNLSFTLARASEFGSESSSGYIRYIAPLRLIRDTIGTDAWTLWIGHGPGTITRQVQSYEFHDPTWAKLLFEYGVLGFVMFLTLFLVALRRPNVPIQIRATLFFAWLVMGGHLLSPELNFLTLAMVGLLPVTPTGHSGAVAGHQLAPDEKRILTSDMEDHAPRAWR